MIETVFFDFGGTLAYEPVPHSESFHTFLCEHDIETTRDEVEAGTEAMEEFNRNWGRQRPGNDSKTLADRFWFNACLHFARHIRSVPDAHDLAELMHASHTIIPYRLYDDTLPALEALAARDLPIGIISNWDAPTLEFATRDLDIRRLFTMVLSSRNAECEKPDPRIFHKACRRANASPETSLMVGDSIAADVEGARAVGMTPVWINRDGAARDVGCATVRALTELPSLLDNLS